MKTEAEIGCIYEPRNARIAGEYQELGERHGIDSPSEGPTLTHLEIGLLASRTERESSYCFKPPRLW